MATKVRQLVPSAGPGGHNANEEYELDDESARRLADAGHVVVLERVAASKGRKKADAKEQPPESSGDAEDGAAAGDDDENAGETGGDSEQPAA